MLSLIGACVYNRIVNCPGLALHHICQPHSDITLPLDVIFPLIFLFGFTFNLCNIWQVLKLTSDVQLILDTLGASTVVEVQVRVFR